MGRPEHDFLSWVKNNAVRLDKVCNKKTDTDVVVCKYFLDTIRGKKGSFVDVQHVLDCLTLAAHCLTGCVYCFL